MGFKKYIFFITLIFVIIPSVSASLSSHMQEVDNYVTQYDSGKVTAPQLIVHLNYIQNKIYEELDTKDKDAFTKSEISTVFDKSDKDWRDYEKIFETGDFKIVFATTRSLEYSSDYWEKREKEAETLYGIYYRIEALESDSQEDIVEQLKDFEDEFVKLVKSGGNSNKEENLKNKLNDIKQRMGEEIKTQDECIEIMEYLGMKEDKENYGEGKKYVKILDQDIKKDCWTDKSGCHEECDTEEVCNNDGECWEEKRNCRQVCDENEECNEYVEKEINMQGHCDKEKSGISVGAWGEGYDRYQQINKHEKWNCNARMNSLVKVRKVLQEDLDNEFAEWYFEEFMAGEDYDKIINGEGGFEAVLQLLIENEEEISMNLNCYEKDGWPEGFEKININYDSKNVNVEVWEKFAPIEENQIKHYTTLFKYSWVPDKQLMKELIEYQISKTNNFGPSAKEIIKIKSDPGKMQIINGLSDKYGGSFDVRIELSQEDKDFAISKYLRVNPDIAVKMADSLSVEGDNSKEDISIKIDYDVFYDFINYMTNEMEGDQINGPHWVNVKGDEGPGKLFSALGALSKMWKEGVTIQPRHALFKLFFSTKDLIGLMQESDSENIWDAAEQKEKPDSEKKDKDQAVTDSEEDNEQETLKQDVQESGDDAGSGRDAPGQEFMEKLGYTEERPDLEPVKVEEGKTYSGSLDVDAGDKMDFYKIKVFNGNTYTVEANPDNSIDVILMLPNKGTDSMSPGGSGNKGGAGEKESDSFVWTDDTDVANFGIFVGTGSSSGSYTFKISKG